MRWCWLDIRNMQVEEYENYYELMTQDKKERVNRYRFVDDKKRTVAGEILARQMISQWCQVEETFITFSGNQYGKPYAIDLPVHFNISHSSNLVVCAIDDNPVGIDVELIREIDLSIARRVCTKHELEYVYSGQFYKRFFRVWTLKEAYFKCAGTGITEFKEVDVFRDISKKECIYLGEYVVSIVTGN